MILNSNRGNPSLSTTSKDGKALRRLKPALVIEYGCVNIKWGSQNRDSLFCMTHPLMMNPPRIIASRSGRPPRLKELLCLLLT
jgi:hypothetical protein